MLNFRRSILLKLQAFLIKKFYSFTKEIHFNLFKKIENKVTFILHPPRSNYDTRKNFSKRGLHRVHFPKIFLNNYSTKHFRENPLLKNFKSRLLHEGKRFANYREENLLFIYIRSIRNPHIMLINLGTFAYTSSLFSSKCMLKCPPHYVSRLYSYKKGVMY